MFFLTMSFDDKRILIACPSVKAAMKSVRLHNPGHVGHARQMKPDHWFGNFYREQTVYAGLFSRLDRCGTYTIQLFTHPIIETYTPHDEMRFGIGDDVLVFIDEHDPTKPVWLPGEVVDVECVFGRHCYVVEIDNPPPGMQEVNVWRFGHEIKREV